MVRSVTGIVVAPPLSLARVETRSSRPRRRATTASARTRDGPALPGRQRQPRRRDRPRPRRTSASRPARRWCRWCRREATSLKMTPVQVPGGRVADVDVAEVAHALRQRVRGEPAASGRPGSAAPAGCCPGAALAAGRRSDASSRSWPGVTVKCEGRVVVLQALVVGELRAGAVGQRDACRSARSASGPKVRPLTADRLRGRAGVGDRDRPGLLAAGQGGRVELVARHQQRRADRAGEPRRS